MSGERDELDLDADRWLVDKVQAGNLDAYEVLVRRHRDRIYRIALRMVGSPQDADDIAQDVIIQLWTAIAGFTGTSTFTTWLYRIVVNRCLNHLRQQRPTRPVLDTDATPAAGADETAIARERVAVTLRAITALPPDLRVVLVLHEMEGLSYREIAVITKTSEPTVRGRLHRARSHLLDELPELVMTLPDQLLRCGRPAGDVLDQVADGRGHERDDHQQRCPHCQAALGEYQRLWAPVLETAAQQIRAPEGLQESAMRRIRGAVEHADYGVLDSPLGVTRIAARVVVVTARETAEAVTGVRVALSRHLTEAEPDGRGPEVEAGVAGRSTALEITLAADYGQDLIALADRVRRVVAARIRALTGLDPVAITVTVDDVLT